MYNSNKGVSVVLLNTEKGKKLFDQAKTALVYKQVPLTDAQEKNGPLNEPSKPFVLRDKVFKEYKKHGVKYILRKYMIRKQILSTLPVRVLRKGLRIIKQYLRKSEANEKNL